MNRKNYYIVTNSLDQEIHKCFIDLIHKDQIEEYLKFYLENIGYAKYEIENWNDFENTLVVSFSERVEFVDPMDELIEIDNKDLVFLGMGNKENMKYSIEIEELKDQLLVEEVKYKREEFKRKFKSGLDTDTGIYSI